MTILTIPIWSITEGGDTAGRVTDLSTTVAHVIDGCRYVALGIGYLHMPIAITTHQIPCKFQEYICS